MRVESVENLYEGMVLGENIFLEGNLLYKEKYIIDACCIEALKSMEINNVIVYDIMDYKEHILDDDTFAQAYLDFFVSGFKGLVVSSMFNKNEFSDISSTVRTYLDQHKNILYDLLKLRCSHCYTYEHSINVALYSVLVGIKLELSNEDLSDLIVGALLHDMGKLKISNHILDKPGRLDDVEFDAIKRHPEYGVDYAVNFKNVSWNVKKIIIQHHEKLDGTGYPCGLKGDEIFFLSKIVTVCDIFDAVISKRSYHEARSPHKGIKVLHEEVELGRVDKDIVAALEAQVAVTPVDTQVILNNGEICTIIKDDSREMEPIVFSFSTGQVYNLENREDLWIAEIK